MLTAQESRNETQKPTRFAAMILFVLVVGMGYAVSPQVEGAVDLPNAVEDQDTAECNIGGLVFSECFPDF